MTMDWLFGKKTVSRTLEDGTEVELNAKVEAARDRLEKEKRNFQEVAMQAYGGVQKCPWCRNLVQEAQMWGFEQSKDDPHQDILKCGICGGTTIWEFHIGMVFIEPGTPPTPMGFHMELNGKPKYTKIEREVYATEQTKASGGEQEAG